MRLTKADKDAFIQAVINDVPQIDYNEKVRVLIKNWAIARMPRVVQDAYREYPQYFDNHYMRTPGGLIGVFAPVLSNVDISKDDPEFWKQLVEINELDAAQDKVISDLKTKVRAMIEGCNTLKTAQERLPEFLKYLPADRDGTGVANLPVANTVADLMNAGWPQGKK